MNRCHDVLLSSLTFPARCRILSPPVAIPARGIRGWLAGRPHPARIRAACKLFLLTVWLVAAGFSAVVAKGQDLLPFRNYRVENGLASSQVNAIFQDSRGYLWFACSSGLSRFSGHHFKTYTNREGLPSNTVLAITEDTGGKLWVGTGRGACFLDSRLDRFKAVPGFTQRVRGFGWIGKTLYCRGNNGRLLRLGPSGQWETAVLPEPAAAFRGMAAVDDTLYLSTGDGALLGIQAGPNGLRVQKRLLIDQLTNAMIADSGGQMWLATNAGLYHLSPDGSRPDGPVPGSEHSPVFCLVRDSAGTIWCGTANGVLRWNGKTLDRFDTRTGLAGSTIRSLHCDREGNIWIGTEHGVSQLAYQQLEIIESPAGFPGTSATAAVWDPYRRWIWLGTAAGLFTMENGNISAYQEAVDFFRQNMVWDVLSFPGGSRWFATDGGGILIQEGARTRILTESDGLPSNEVLDLCLDSQQRIWAATRGGLALIVQGRITAFTGREGLPANYIRCLQEVPGMPGMMLGTIGQGLVYFDGSRFHPLMAGMREIPSVYALHWQSDKLWIATDDGYYSWDRQAGLAHFGESSGLTNLFCSSFQAAGEHTCWIGTDAGSALIDTRTGRMIKSISWGGSLISDEYTTHNCSTRDENGDFIIGVFGGLVRLHKEILDSRPGIDELRPRVCLDHAQVTLKGGHIETLFNVSGLLLPADYRSIRFHYDALWYRNPGAVQLSTCLKGYDEAFSALGRNFQREYTNLPAGEYQFIVRQYTGGQLQGEQALATFWVASPRWRNPLFLLLMAVCAGFTVYLGFRWRYRAMERDRERLEEMVNLSTRELERKNNLLARLAVTDELTGLFNRRFFVRALQQEYRRLARSRQGECFSLIMLDLDHFKTVNDTWGHETGDRMLQHMARAIRSGLRSTDTLARFGGDEFIALLPQTDKIGAEFVAEKIRRIIEYHSMERNSQSVRCTVSQGLVTLVSPIQYFEELASEIIQRADSLMYKAKSAGRNQFLSALLREQDLFDKPEENP